MKFYKGMDISTIKEVESLGGKFYDHGAEKDVFEILKSYGTNAVRLRLWNDPYSEDGTPYGAGTNDLPTTIELAKRAKAHGMEVLLCITAISGLTRGNSGCRRRGVGWVWRS